MKKNGKDCAREWAKLESLCAEKSLVIGSQTLQSRAKLLSTELQGAYGAIDLVAQSRFIYSHTDIIFLPLDS